MNLTHVLLIAIVAYVIYTYIQSYNQMSQELREIRLKCMATGVKMVSAPTKEPLTVMSGDILRTLQSIQSAVADKAKM